MTSRISIGRQIGIQIAVLVTALMAIYSVTVAVVYDWGLDDNTHYFLSLEADRVLATLERTGQLPPPTSPNTQYFATPAQLPPAILSAFPAAQHQDGRLLSDEIAGDVRYLLPYRHPATGPFFYVYHVYHASTDAYDVGLSVPQLLLILAAGAAVVVALLVAYLAWSIIRPVRALEQWATALQPDAPLRAIPSAALKFTELQAVAGRLHDAVAAMAQHNEHEKHFLRTLSHELRTPLAIITAALNLLEKKPERLDGSQRRKLELIQRANANMLATTECLLWLWTDQQRHVTKEAVDVNLAVANIVGHYQHLLQGKQVLLHLQIPDDLHFCVEIKLFEMTLGNLVRNAFQYSEAGTVEIHASPSTITVRNPIAAPADLTDFAPSPPSEPNDYGYGVGLYLVENICARCDWGLHIQHQSGLFAVTIRLNADNTCA